MKLRDLFTKKQPAPIERPVYEPNVVLHAAEALDSGRLLGVYTQTEQDAITGEFLKKPLQHLEDRQ